MTAADLPPSIPRAVPRLSSRIGPAVAPELPWITLILLSITFAEFLTGSTFVLTPLLNPISALFLIGLYGGGVLLVREASVRWQKGWPSILLLGVAYGIAEEGIGTKTFFGPAGVGHLATYGHYLGVNWVWSVELALFHSVFSITLPILVVGLLYPSTEGRSFLPTRRALVGTVLAFLTTLGVMFLLFNPTETPSTGGLLAAIGVIGLCIAAARWVPSGLGSLGPEALRAPSSLRFAAVRGGVFSWGFFGIAWIGSEIIPIPSLTALLLAAWSVLFGLDVFRHRSEYRRPVARLDFAFGCLSLLLVLGSVYTFFGDYGAIAAVAGTVFLYLRLRDRLDHAPRTTAPPSPAAPQAAPG